MRTTFSAAATGRLKDSEVTVFVRGTAVSLGRGVYRFHATPPRVEVFLGRVSAANYGVPVFVGPGRTISLDDPGQASVRFDTSERTAFQIWSERRIAALAKASGIADWEDDQDRENDAAAWRAARIEEQTHDPSSIHFDPLAPAPQWQAVNPQAGGSGRPHICPI